MNNLLKIKLLNFKENNKLNIAFIFDYHSDIKTKLKELHDIQWSSERRQYYVPHNTNTITRIKSKLASIAYVDSSKLLGNPENNLSKANREHKLKPIHKDLLNGFYRYLLGKRYSKSTITTYTNYVAEFFAFHHIKPIKELTNRDVELFIEAVFIKRKYSISSQRQFISALKLFVIYEPSMQIDDLELVRPSKSRRLPIILSQQEVVAIISKTKNLKHRALIALTYSCGLRISEVLSLRIADIDITRKQIFVRNSKGRKDRYVGLADSFIPLLNNYFNTYTPAVFFIEGKNGGRYSQQSVRAFLKRSCSLANIEKKVTPHTLRHSYATHLLENGVNLRYIQSLLGHAKPETTMLYTHVMQSNLLNIENPLDIAVRKLKQSHNNNKNVALSRES